MVTEKVRDILSHYASDNPGVRTNLSRIMMTGKLSGTGKMIVLPVDQGFEHGPARSFASNPKAYDPSYHVQLAIDAGLNAYAAPLGMLEAIAGQYAGAIPLILKMNSANALSPSIHDYDQAITASVSDALRLGCSAIGFTIYPGSDNAGAMMEEIQSISAQAKACGLAVVIWSYPRGKGISKQGETAVDVVAYAAHLAALLGAHIIKVKLPTIDIEREEHSEIYSKYSIPCSTLTERVEHVMQSAFDGKRIVLFSGGASKDLEDIYQETHAIKDGGGNGSIIGRNTFQRNREEALSMLAKLIHIYREL